MKKHIILLAATFVASFSANSQFWNFTDPVVLPGTVNSETAEENMPVFSKDSSILYFVRTFDPNNTGGVTDQDIWQSSKQSDGSYADLQRVKNLNNKFNNAAVGISKDGTVMYVLNTYEGKRDVKKGISFSDGKSGKWGAPEAINIPNLDIQGDFYGFHVSEDEKTIIISHEGPGSLGKEDLYVSVKTGNTWSEPIHMGNSVNTSGFEISPFLSESQDTLYFSSNGLGGEGDADIFYAVKQGSWSEWSKPVNLGNRINSPKFDAYFNFTGQSAYWSSNRNHEGSDIYMIEILPPEPILITCIGGPATAYDKEDGFVNATVKGGAGTLTYLWSNGSKTKGITDLSKGEYTVTVTDEAGQMATAKYFVDQPEKPIDPIVVSNYDNYEFKHVFDYNKNKLSMKRGDLRRFANDIEKDFKDGRQSVTIKITSSASNVPTKTFGTNQKLAEIRAENVKYDLMDHFKKKYADRVNIVIVDSVVSGPTYNNDAANRGKYEPYQFVELKTE